MGPPTSQSPLLLEDTRPRLATMEILLELSMRFPDFSLPLLFTSKRTLTEEPLLLELAPSSPTPLSRGRLMLTQHSCTELMDTADSDMAMATMDLAMPDMDTPTMAMLTMVKYKQ